MRFGMKHFLTAGTACLLSGLMLAAPAAAVVSESVLTDQNGDGMVNVFDYVLSKGLTGSITGTMKEYSIDSEKKTAEITITLNTGGSFKATYNKAKDEFSFSGL